MTTPRDPDRRPPYYRHATVGAVASVLHDRLKVEGGVALLKRAHRIRLEITGSEMDLTRVLAALDADGFASSIALASAIIGAVRDAPYVAGADL